jgi:hypothetical protein
VPFRSIADVVRLLAREGRLADAEGLFAELAAEDRAAAACRARASDFLALFKAGGTVAELESVATAQREALARLAPGRLQPLALSDLDPLVRPQREQYLAREERERRQQARSLAQLQGDAVVEEGFSLVDRAAIQMEEGPWKCLLGAATGGHVHLLRWLLPRHAAAAAETKCFGGGQLALRLLRCCLTANVCTAAEGTAGAAGAAVQSPGSEAMILARVETVRLLFECVVAEGGGNLLAHLAPNAFWPYSQSRAQRESGLLALRWIIRQPQVTLQ